jgi:hypothetical protein
MAKAHQSLAGGRQCRPHRVEIVEMSMDDVIPANGVSVSGVAVKSAGSVVGWSRLRF